MQFFALIRRSSNGRNGTKPSRRISNDQTRAMTSPPRHLRKLWTAPPVFLERLVVDLLIAMGYGGGDATMGRVTGRSGDRGIDGTIREDALGLDEVYIQAKKYGDGSTVGESDLQRK